MKHPRYGKPLTEPSSGISNDPSPLNPPTLTHSDAAGISATDAQSLSIPSAKSPSGPTKTELANFP